LGIEIVFDIYVVLFNILSVEFVLLAARWASRFDVQNKDGTTQIMKKLVERNSKTKFQLCYSFSRLLITCSILEFLIANCCGKTPRTEPKCR
jgi:hypothetical protein